MKCSVAREMLSARLDGESGPVSAAELDEHSADCPACRRWYTEASEMVRQIRLAPGPRVPDLVDRILTAATRPVPPRR